MSEKFTTQLGCTLLHDPRKIAREEGRSLRQLVEEALSDLIDQPQGGKPRATVTSYLSSIERSGGRAI